MNEASQFIEKIFKLPEEITNDEYLVIPSEQIKKILTDKRVRIIEMLYNQNPLTEEKLSDLFRYDTHDDLVLLRHLNLIAIQKIDDNNKHNIITLNRKIKVA